MEKLLYKECENCKDWNGNICHCMEICWHPICALEEFNEYRKIGTLEELKRIKALYEKVDFERLSKLSQGEDIETFTVNVNFSYNQLLDRDEAVALLIENIINILDKEAEHGHSESD